MYQIRHITAATYIIVEGEPYGLAVYSVVAVLSTVIDYPFIRYAALILRSTGKCQEMRLASLSPEKIGFKTDVSASRQH